MLDRWLASLNLDPAARGFQVVPARLAGSLSPELPALVIPEPGASLTALKERLLEIYPSATPVKVIGGEGTAPAATTLGALDAFPGEPEAIFIDSRLPEEVPRTFRALEHIVARLRAPDGCPWDRQQTHQSTKPFLLEEVYEAVDAIDREDWADLREELGDVLFHVLFQAQLAREEGRFNLGDVLETVNTKLIRRHPHVFGDVKVASIDEIWANWEELKRAEKGEAGASPLAGVPLAMPALAYAAQVFHRLRRFAIPAPEADRFLQVAAYRLHDLEAGIKDPGQVLGELLLALALYAAAREVDPEDALRQANRRLAAAVEAAVRMGTGLDPGKLFDPA